MGWLRLHMERPPDTDECIRGPFALSHNGHAVAEGESVGRIMLGLAKGNPQIVRHLCIDAPWCVNIRHITRGTPAENSRDMVKAGHSLAGTRNPFFGRGRYTGKRI